MSPRSCRPDLNQVCIVVIKSPGINFAYAQLQPRPFSCHGRNWPNRDKCELLLDDKDRPSARNNSFREKILPLSNRTAGISDFPFLEREKFSRSIGLRLTDGAGLSHRASTHPPSHPARNNRGAGSRSPRRTSSFEGIDDVGLGCIRFLPNDAYTKRTWASRFSLERERKRGAGQSLDRFCSFLFETKINSSVLGRGIVKKRDVETIKLAKAARGRRLRGDSGRGREDSMLDAVGTGDYKS